MRPLCNLLFAGDIKLLRLLSSVQNQALRTPELCLRANSDPIFWTKLEAWSFYNT